MKNALRVCTSACAIWYVVAAGTVAATAEPVSVSVTTSSQYQFTKVDRGFAPVPGADDLSMHSAISETAVQVKPHGSLFDFQGDLSVANNWFSGDWAGQQTTDWHLGMALYARDENLGILGLETAIGGLEGISGTDRKSSASLRRVGVRADYFWNDHVTSINRVGYVSLDGPVYNMEGLYGNAGVNWYLSENLAAKIDFDYALLNVTGRPQLELWATTVEGEYIAGQVFGTDAAFFAGARMSEFETGGPWYNEFQGFAGVRMYFGNATTLRDHHRSGPQENNALVLERLPFAMPY
ncbi:MAG: hypothetical protein WBD37_13330 [Anderseniella sp.]